jgi:hypothetical protein
MKMKVFCIYINNTGREILMRDYYQSDKYKKI